MNLKTKLHIYRFDLREPDQAKAWQELRDHLKPGPHCMESHNGGQSFHYNEWMRELDVELECEHLFSNQWNTAPIPGVSDIGYRVFDWALDFEPNGNRHIKQGHYLDQTEEMREIRRNTHVCGYCGRQEPAAKGYTFCPHCIGSEYLKAGELCLTRMRPVYVEINVERAPLTEAEREHLLPLYREAQLHGNTERDRARLAQQRRDLKEKHDASIRNANAEFEGFTWLLDHGLKIDNVIYYSHTGRFEFGWRKPIDAEYLSQLLDIVSEFPFDYDIKKERQLV
jgi:hypothetical protein